MTDPEQDRLDEIEEHIEAARKKAEEHGTIKDGKQTFADPEGDGTDNPFVVNPPG